jgi:hypothetical protein
MNAPPLSVYIGYDKREDAAYRVCKASLETHSSIPLRIVRLDADLLRNMGLYRRGWVAQEGQRIDLADGRPFSTDFAFTRFLVPALSLYQGWALFCDCDFLFTADIAELAAMANERYAALCVKHDHIPAETVKMDGASQGRYRRKNWSSLVLWNCAHPANSCLTMYCVNRMPGRWLHGFDWLRDELIGELPPSWNWLARVNEPLPTVPKGIHFTLGIPTMPGCADTPYAELWRAALASLAATEERGNEQPSSR